ncbi:MAG: PfkB family carbohydrate kinase, partial [Bdellovibrionota bacterium]
DVSGAGDTVIAVLSLALSAGASIDEAAVLGNLAAGVEVGKRGTATVSPQEIRVAMEFFGTMGV